MCYKFGSNLFVYLFTQGVKSLIDDFVRRTQPLVFYNVKPSVNSIFQGVRPAEFNCCTTELQLHEMLKGIIFSQFIYFLNYYTGIFCLTVERKCLLKMESF